jgi:polyphosphate kinase
MAHLALATRETNASAEAGPSPIQFANEYLTRLKSRNQLLERVGDPSVPLHQRIKLYRMMADELDDLFMVGAGHLKSAMDVGHDADADGPLCSTLLGEIRAHAGTAASHLHESWRDRLQPELADRCGVSLVRRDQLTDEQRAHLKQRFLQDAWPLLTPLVVDQAHLFPRLRNRGLSLALLLERRGERVGHRAAFAVLAIPTGLGRFVEVTPTSAEGSIFILLEDLIAMHVHLLFPGLQVKECSLFRVTWAGSKSVTVEGEVKVVPKRRAPTYGRRERGRPVRLELTRQASSENEALLRHSLGLGSEDVYRVDGPFDVAGLCGICGHRPMCVRCAAAQVTAES